MLEPIVLYEVMQEAIKRKDVAMAYKCAQLLDRYDKKFTNRKEVIKQLKKVKQKESK